MDTFTQEIVKLLFHYDYETGNLIWKQGQYKGFVAGTKTERDITINIDGTLYRAHRIVWLWHYGEPVPNLIDHKDTNPFHNRIENLREATQSQNLANARIRKDNTSGIKGVSFFKRDSKWRASITINGRAINLGHFNTIEEATKVRQIAFEKQFGKFARH